MEELCALRRDQRYVDLTALIVPESSDAVVRFVRAVDEFLAANRRLCDWLAEHAGFGLGQTIDQSYLADDLRAYAGEDLGVLSRHVELLDEAVVGDRATVTYAVEERMPAGRARLRKVGGVWRFDPGAGCPEELPAAMSDMARGLDTLRGELESGALAIEPLRDDPELLIEKVKARLRRGVNLLSKAEAARTGRASEP
jgi:hypothetical protein